MKIHPALGIAIGLVLLIIGLVAHLITLDIAGGFVMFVSAVRMMRDRRGSRP
jgi:small neutral amino acid transporter SnatA (MarC family)